MNTPRLTHLLDQLHALAGHLAPVVEDLAETLESTAPPLVAYRRALIAAGMPEEEAFVLVLDAQRQMFGRYLDAVEEDAR
jgi:hypothetical protein